MTKRIAWVLGLVLVSVTATAQQSDKLKLDRLPPLAFAAMPRTEAEFLAKYGTSESNRALIKWWFRRRHLNHALIGTSAAMFAVGVTVPSQLNKKGHIGEANTIGIVGALGGGIVLISSLSANKRWRTARLNALLNDPKSIDPVMLARAGVPVRAQGFDQLLATSNQSDTSHSKRLSKQRRLMSAYLSVYGHSDSNRKLIRYWFRQRTTATIMTVGGSVCVLVGLGHYVYWAGESALDVTAQAITGGLYEPDPPSVSGTGHALFFGGLIVGGIGVANLKAHTRSRLQQALSNPNLLSKQKWSRILRSTAKASSEPSALPSAKE